jgi:hypothetical protein
MSSNRRLPVGIYYPERKLFMISLPEFLLVLSASGFLITQANQLIDLLVKLKNFFKRK